MKKQSTQLGSVLAKILPAEADLQRDLAGRPINVGDRIDDTEYHGGGIVVSVHGSVLIYLCDYHNGDPAMGAFTYGSCDRVRVLPPVTDIESAVVEVLVMRDKLDEVQAGYAEDGDAAPHYNGLTYLDREFAVDAHGKPVRPGDLLIGTDDVINSGFAPGGIVVGVAGAYALLQFNAEDGSNAYDGVEVRRYIVQPKGGRR